MGKIHWYKRDPDAALTGMKRLTLEQRGAYNTVLDLIYSTANKLEDDDRFLSGWMGTDVRVWKRLKRELSEAGKIRIEGGYIHNSRADAVVDECLARYASAAEAGVTSARSKAPKSMVDSREINELHPTVATTVVPTVVPTNQNKTETQSQKEETKSDTVVESEPPVIDVENPEPRLSARAKARADAKARSTLVGDYRPGQKARENAIKFWHEKGREDLIGRLDEQIEAFVAHHRHKGTRGLDWDAGWRTWYGNALQYTKPPADWKPPKPNGNGHAIALSPAEWDGIAARWFGSGGLAPRTYWPNNAGPKPGQPGCKCPLDCLKKYEDKVKAERRAA